MVASDLTLELLEAGRTFAARHGVTVQWEEADAEALPYGDGEGHWQTVHGRDQVQPQSPESAGVAGAVAVPGPTGQLGAEHRLPGAGALAAVTFSAASASAVTPELSPSSSPPPTPGTPQEILARSTVPVLCFHRLRDFRSTTAPMPER